MTMKIKKRNKKIYKKEGEGLVCDTPTFNFQEFKHF